MISKTKNNKANISHAINVGDFSAVVFQRLIICVMVLDVLFLKRKFCVHQITEYHGKHNQPNLGKEWMKAEKIDQNPEAKNLACKNKQRRKIKTQIFRKPSRPAVEHQESIGQPCIHYRYDMADNGDQQV